MLKLAFCDDEAVELNQISTLRESQELARRYRHDLRHHLQYISTCIQNGRTEQVQAYISDICKEGIDMNVRGTLPEHLLISERDLCVLLSNALENALHACQSCVAAGKAATIDVQFYEKEGKLFLQITNPYQAEIHFENGVPVTDRARHGIGVKSICAIVERYQGLYSFQAKGGKFILRLYL